MDEVSRRSSMTNVSSVSVEHSPAPVVPKSRERRRSMTALKIEEVAAVVFSDQTPQKNKSPLLPGILEPLHCPPTPCPNGIVWAEN